MPSEPAILAFDTSAAHCAAALLFGGRIVAQTCEEMARGQAERLMPLLGEVLAYEGMSWRDLDRIGVGVGPGNFTGIRIGVSAARGLALGLGIPAVGVNTFDAIEAHVGQHCVPCVAAPRGQSYLRDRTTGEPYLATQDELLDMMEDGVLETSKGAWIAGAIGRVAAERAAEPRTPPAPLYIRPADAAPARDDGLRLL
ncbi:MAG: tRNA (adenosine(37)-N6)-threonylcarbamoyltransferase complex dimerization subunit type 1 TsaB [Pseudomonadota bacterium]